MDLQKVTDIGRITISEKVLAELFLSVFSEEEFKDRIWAATKRGKLIQKGTAFAESDAVSIMEFKREEERLVIGFSAITKFGVSIGGVTRELADRMAEICAKHDGNPPKRIRIDVIGVKKENSINRIQDMTKEYEY